MLIINDLAFFLCLFDIAFFRLKVVWITEKMQIWGYCLYFGEKILLFFLKVRCKLKSVKKFFTLIIRKKGGKI